MYLKELKNGDLALGQRTKLVIISFNRRERSPEERCAHACFLRKVKYSLRIASAKAVIFAGLMACMLNVYRTNLSAQSTDVPLEYQLKAACLFNFAKYVKWPASVFSTDQDPIRICIIKPNPFGNLFELLANKTAQNRQVVAEMLDRDELQRAKECHILFYSADSSDWSDNLEKALKSFGVLTVTENRGKGIIQFVMMDGKVRFEIDNTRAKQAGLSIHSQVLKLATEVKDDG